MPQTPNLQWLHEESSWSHPPSLSNVIVEVPSSTSVPPCETERIVFLITKDNAERIKLTLPSLLAASDRVYVIDSSRSFETRDLCGAMNAVNLIYHGVQEQAQEIAAQPVLQQALKAGLITRLSTDCWDIWSKRNYILLLAVLNGFSHVLLADDDVIAAPGLIEDVLSLSRTYSLVGANIRGMRDVSVIEHIYSLKGVQNREFISGHFLAVNVPLAVRHCFCDLYNEDWVFIMLNSLSTPVARYGTIFHLYWNPFAQTERRAASEERGEIFIDGLARSIVSGAGLEPLSSADYWDRVISNRRAALDKLAEDEMLQNMPVVAGILASARTVVGSVTAPDLVRLWQNYCSQLREWRAIIGLAELAKSVR